MAKAKSLNEVLAEIKKEKEARAAAARGNVAVKKLKAALETASAEISKNAKPLIDSEE